MSVTSKQIPWPSFKKYNFGLRVVETALGQKVIVPVVAGKDGELLPYKGKQNHFALKQCGFKVTNNLYWRDASAFTISSFRKHFPDLERVILPMDSVILRKPEWASLHWHIGINNRSENIYLDFNAKRAVSDNGRIVFESGKDIDSRFLRAYSYENNQIDQTSLSESCDGFVIGCASKKMSHDELILLASSVSGRQVDEFDLNYKVVNDAVEAAIHRAVRGYAGTDKSKYEFAQLLYNNQPQLNARTSKSVSLQQFSTPVPMSSVLGHILNNIKPSDNKHVFEPCVGTGSLIAPLQGIGKASGIDLDDARVNHAKTLSRAMNVVVGDATDINEYKNIDPADVVVANPPFGGIKKTIINNTAITRIDHEICMHAIDKMKDDGVAGFIIGADGFMPNKVGKVSGGSQYFLNYLYANYNVLDTIELSGRLYANQGSKYPTRMIIIDGRKSTPDDALAPKKLKIVDSYSELWDWSNNLISGHEAVISIDKSIDLDKDDEQNKFQTVYRPASKVVSDQEALIPKNLAAPVAEALITLEQENGDIDSMVAKSLQMDQDTIGDYFSASQIDAIALSISNIRSGGSMIIGDQTGFGKGRIMAALVRFMILNGRKPIFLTEKANLFSDMIRDLKDINSLDMINPLILNSGKDADLIDSSDGGIEILTTSRSQSKMRSEFIKDGSMSDHINMIFTTYSQLNRESSTKTNALLDFVTNNDSAILMDEAHNAAGESNINTNVSSLLSVSGIPCIYASATAIKTYKNLNIYLHPMGLPYSVDELVSAGESGGEAFLQVMTTMLAKEGKMIRREYSMDNVKFSKHEPSDENLSQNFTMATEISSILRNMSVLSGEVSAVVSEVRSDIKEFKKRLEKSGAETGRMGVTYIGFGSSLHNINRQLMLAMRTQEMISDIKADVKIGKKPVVALDYTMDSLIGSLLDDLRPGQSLKSMPSMADALIKATKRLTVYVKRDNFGISKHVEATDPDIIEWANKIIDQINQSDYLRNTPLNVFDTITQSLNNEGISTAEVSGRKYNVIENEKGEFDVMERIQPNRTMEVSKFNNGSADVILLSGAGSTGISLHSSGTFKDQRPRVMHIAQANQDISRFIQTLGRINRNGQVCQPEIKFHTSGITGEKRELGALVSKLSSLMASSTANRSSHIDTLVDGTVDIVNYIGDKAVFDYLKSDCDVAQHLDIDLDEYESDQDKLEDGWLAKRFLGRMTLLTPGSPAIDMIDMDNPTHEDRVSQIYVYHQVMTIFNSIVNDMEARGESPFAIIENDWKAKTLRKQLYSGNDSEDIKSAFDAPCYIEEIEFVTHSEPLTSARVKHIIKTANDRNVDRIKFYDNLNPSKLIMDKRLQVVKKYLKPLTFESMSDQEALDMLKSFDKPYINRLYDQMEKIAHCVNIIKTGSIIKYETDDGDIDAVITNFKIPEPMDIHRSSAYRISIAIAGQEHVSHLTMSSLLDIIADNKYTSRRPLFHVQGNYMDNQSIKAASKSFDNAPTGEYNDKRIVLTGNMIEAAMADKGHLATFTDQSDVRHTSFLLPHSSRFDATVNAGIKCRDANCIAELLIRGDVNMVSNSSQYKSSNNIAIFPTNDGNFRISVPSSIKRGGKYFKDCALTNITGEFSGTRAVMCALVNHDQLKQSLPILIKSCGGIHLAGQGLDAYRRLLAMQSDRNNHSENIMARG